MKNVQGEEDYCPEGETRSFHSSEARPHQPDNGDVHLRLDEVDKLRAAATFRVEALREVFHEHATEYGCMFVGTVTIERMSCFLARKAKKKAEKQSEEGKVLQMKRTG